MIDYAGEWCHAYEAALRAIADGADPLRAAQASVGTSWTVLPIARAAAQAALRDFAGGGVMRASVEMGI